jgi:hypothetical protein
VEGFLEVVELKHPYRGNARLATASVDKCRVDIPLEDDGRYFLDIVISADNVAPREKRCEYSVRDRNQFAEVDDVGGFIDTPLPRIDFRFS